MRERYYVGAYWRGRVEPVESYARRAEALFEQLASCDPTLTRWFELAGSRAAALRSQFTPTAEALSALFRKKRYLKGGNELSFAAWNGEPDGEACGVNWSCGSTFDRILDLCIFEPPSQGAAADRLLTAPEMTKVLRSMVLAWDPEWGIATSDVHRDDVLKNAKVGTFVGWVMYFSRDRGTLPPLPDPVRVESIGDKGSLVVLTPERFTAGNPKHVALAASVQELLEQAGLLKPLKLPKH